MNTKKSTTKVSGIYKIVNKVNGKYYIGSSDNIFGTTGRWMEHVNSLNAGKHDNSYLQRAWNKYGKDSFELVILENVPKSKLLIVEQLYLEKSKSEHHKQCYNLSFCACGGGFLGHNHTEESKRKISEKLKGRPSPNRGPNSKLEGERNSGCDHTIYTFKNNKTGEVFIGKRCYFRKKFGLTGVDKLVTKKYNTCSGWILCH